MSGADPAVDPGRGATIFGCAGPVLLPEERAFFREADPFGFILFARNVETPAQLARLTADLRAAVGREAPILVDQEGGRVQRMRAPYWREWSPPLDAVQAAPDLRTAARIMYLRARLIAAELRAVGIDADCAPLADIARAETHPFLRNRCYGETVETVSTVARAVADGLSDGGVMPVFKHLPGHGRAHTDSHLSLPRVTVPHAELSQVDFAAFRPLGDLPMGMTAHIVFEDIDPAAPATQSARMIRLIREEIGFDGLLMTDDLNMEALSGSLFQRTEAAIAAGCDIALHCKGDLAQMQEVAAAAGEMGEGARARALRALAARRAPADVDMAALDAELHSLKAGAITAPA